MTRLLVLLFLALGLPANAADWELQSNKGGIAVYTARVPGQELRAFRGVTVLPAPARSVLALLADVGNMPSWFFHMKSARELDPSAGHYGHNHYLVIAGIWPVRDRDVAIRASTSQQADGVTPCHCGLRIWSLPTCLARHWRQSGARLKNRLMPRWILKDQPKGVSLSVGLSSKGFLDSSRAVLGAVFLPSFCL